MSPEAVTLPEIPPDQLRPWDILDSTLQPGVDWVLPSLADIAYLSEHQPPDVIVPPDEVLALGTLSLPTQDQVNAGELNHVLWKMLQGLGGGGVGINAVQVGEPVNLIGIKLKDKNQESQLRFLVGAQFTPDLELADAYERRGLPGLHADIETCLTFARYGLVVARPLRHYAGWLTADYEVHCIVDGDNNILSVEAGSDKFSHHVKDNPGEFPSVEARAAQHEIDHLQRIFFIDSIKASDAAAFDILALAGVRKPYYVHREHFDGPYRPYVGKERAAQLAAYAGKAPHVLPGINLQVVPESQLGAFRRGQVAMPRWG